ncbi:DUF2283 domain-containing protein [Nodosilinea sp. LEGE 07088]|uniref:DUF2283 domain-containing protein n=1 Tax=Nodosilinea sp. LEGE 07088 TaxID=2777968 RepID=UPI00187F577D|nr:DUF2283 domain-containing protein [Nodosilinea sp. LEGE 07088]MBE9139943.1 DUF2283 domain-containing protein [Nodosilinea sp. LEGE 07088]
MDTLKILQASEQANWDYDDEADVLYLSVGEPRSAVGIDIGDGVVLRYDEETQAVVGLTVMGYEPSLLRRLS